MFGHEDEDRAFTVRLADSVRTVLPPKYKVSPGLCSLRDAGGESFPVLLSLP